MLIKNGILSNVQISDILSGDYTIPNSVIAIGESAFLYCSALKEITIPDSVTAIGGHAFSRCSALKEITIPTSVTAIGGYAFSHCTSLKEITIPDSVISIGGHAFFQCSSLKEIRYSSKALSVLCADGIITEFVSGSHFSDNIVFQKGNILGRMIDGKWEKTSCFVAEQNGIYAHGNTLQEAKEDLLFKLAVDRGADQYKNIALDKQLPFAEVKTMYQIITGACKMGTESFISTLKETPETISVNQAIALTKGQYRGDVFHSFFE